MAQMHGPTRNPDPADTIPVALEGISSSVLIAAMLTGVTMWAGLYVTGTFLLNLLAG
jgi:hypothetical protein